MEWLTEDQIEEFINRHNYDVRVSGNGRWIDQKCTSDVMAAVADCINNFVSENGDIAFTSYDIWNADYTNQYIPQAFSKPDLTTESARHEYDKFFAQPMKLLANAGVLEESQEGKRNIYRVLETEVLNYIALRERNALTFISLYISKVLLDSGLAEVFEDFFCKQTKEAYDTLKDAFSRFTIRYTPIKKPLECNRIFTKVINPLAYLRHLCGTERGHISKHVITFDMLMYNRDNFRDLYSDKPKDMTRQEYAIQIGANPNPGYYHYTAQRAKQTLRQYNEQFRGGRSEILEGPDAGSPAIHMHHIFPEASYPEISAYLENLIALTPTQHLTYAHPMGNTQLVNLAFQHICLIAKTNSIGENLAGDPRYIIYEFAKFMYVLDAGLTTDEYGFIEDNDFEGVITKVNLHYS